MTKMAKEKDNKRTKSSGLKPHWEHKKEFIEIINALGYKHGKYTVFDDFLTMFAYAISNSVDPLHREEREKVFLECQGKYDQKEQESFSRLCTLLIMAMETTLYSVDMLGEIYHELNLHNESNGQFFTPMHICELMAKISVGNLDDQINDAGYITVCEPTCGSGAMVIAAAGVVAEQNHNPSSNMCVLAVDNDKRCAMMAYIQLSLLGIPAVVVHGDSLRVEEYSRFYTPLYMFGGWIWKQNMSLIDGICADDEKLRCIFEPTYYLLKYGMKNESEEQK